MLRSGDQGALASSLPHGVTIEDKQAMALMIEEPTKEVSAQTVLAEVVGKLLAQGVQTGGVDISQEAAEGGAVGQAVTPKECHEGAGEWLQAIDEGLQGGLATEGIAEEHGDEVDYVIMPSPPTGEAHMLSDRLKHAALREMAGQEDQFGEPGRDRRNVVGVGVDLDERCRNRGHMQLLRRSRKRLHRSIVAEWPGGLPPQLQLVAHLVGDATPSAKFFPVPVALLVAHVCDDSNIIYQPSVVR